MNLERRFRISMIAYAFLAVAIWTTMSSDKVSIGDHAVSFRLIALLILGLWVLRTWLYRRAEQIRAGSDEQ